jgi:polar amino acid transport system substrate-binding protein
MLRFVLLMLASFNAMACHLTLRVPTEAYPPAFIKKQQGWSGHSVEMARVMLAKADCQLSILSMPFGRALKALERGNLDMMMHLTKTPQRDEIYSFIGPMAHETLLLFTRKNSLSIINTLSELEKNKLAIGAVRGIYYGNEFDTLYQQNNKFRQNIVLVGSIEQMLNMFMKQRTQGFLFSAFYGGERQQAFKKLAGIEMTTSVLWQQPIYFAFSRASVKAKDIIKLQQAFEQSLKHPLFKYALDDWVNK